MVTVKLRDKGGGRGVAFPSDGGTTGRGSWRYSDWTAACGPVQNQGLAAGSPQTQADTTSLFCSSLREQNPNVSPKQQIGLRCKPR